MKLAIVAALFGSATAFAPAMQGVRSTALSATYKVKVVSEEHGIDATFDFDTEGDLDYIVGEFVSLGSIDTLCDMDHIVYISSRYTILGPAGLSSEVRCPLRVNPQPGKREMDTYE